MTCKEVLDTAPELKIFLSEEEIENNAGYYTNVDQFIKYLKNNHYVCSSTAVMHYSIFIEEKYFSGAKGFIDIVKPEYFVEEDDCGIYFRGLDEISNSSVKELFLEILKVQYIKTSKYTLKRYYKDIPYITFIRGTDMEKLYKSLSNSMRHLFLELSIRCSKVEIYRELAGIYIKDEEDGIDLEEKITYDLIAKFLKGIFNCSDTEITKTILLLSAKDINLERVHRNHHNNSVTIRGYNYWDMLDLDIASSLDEENYTVVGNALYRGIVAIQPKKMVESFNNNLLDVLFSIYYAVLYRLFNDFRDVNKIRFIEVDGSVVLHYEK